MPPGTPVSVPTQSVTSSKMSKRSTEEHEPTAPPLRLLACDDLGLVKGELQVCRLRRGGSPASLIIYLIILIACAGVQAPSLAHLGEAQVVSTWYATPGPCGPSG